MKYLSTTIFLLFSCTLFAQNTVSMLDFEVSLGEGWKGSLTYKDYSSGKMTTLKTRMHLEKIDETTLLLSTFYSDEPEADTKEKMKITKNGSFIYGQEIMEKTKTASGLLKIVTKNRGKDNGKKATFYHTYIIGKNVFRNRKDVQLDGTDERFMRNEYLFER